MPLTPLLKKYLCVKAISTFLQYICKTVRFSNFFFQVLTGDAARTHRRSQELRLAAMGSIVCLFEIVWFAFVRYYVVHPLPDDIFLLIYDSLSDVYSGINPYLIFAFSSAVRHRVKALVFRKHQQSSPVTALPTNIGNMGFSPRTSHSRPSPRTVVVNA
jgi:hypothetical protein